MSEPIKLYKYAVDPNSNGNGFHLNRSKYDIRLDRYCFDQILAHVWESTPEAKDAINLLKTRFESFNPDVKS